MGVTVAVAGASGYAGGELLRLLAGHPEFEVGVATAHPGGCAHVGRAPAPGRPRPELRGDQSRRPRPTPTSSSWPCRTASPRRSPRDLPAGRRSSTSAPTTGWSTPTRGRRTTAARTPARGRTACPSCRASGNSSPRRTGSPPPAATPAPSRWPSPRCIAAGIASPRRRGRRGRLRHHRRRSHAQAAPARQRGDGRSVRVQGRRPPAHPGDQAGHRRPFALVHPAARPDAPRHPRHGDRPSRPRRAHVGTVRDRAAHGVRERAVRARAARGRLAAHRGHSRLATRATCRPAWTPTPAGSSS